MLTDVHGCGFWCDVCELWQPIGYAALTGCRVCFATMHSLNFPERYMKPPSSQELDEHNAKMCQLFQTMCQKEISSGE